jgi:hypothetical protein
MRSSRVRTSRRSMPCTCPLLGLPGRTQVPTSASTLRINPIKPMASGRRGGCRRSQTTFRVSTIGRHPVRAAHEKHSKESNRSDPSSQTRKHGSDQRPPHRKGRATRPMIIHSHGASRSAYCPFWRWHPLQSRFDCVLDATHGTLPLLSSARLNGSSKVHLCRNIG